MDTIIASLITGIFAVVAVLITNGYSKKKGYDKIDSKIGELYNTTLSRQHEDIKDSIFDKTEILEKSIIEKTSSIYSKVDNIDKITSQNKNLYENLNLEQKEVKTNLDKLVFDWQKTIAENKQLLSQNRDLVSENKELLSKNDELISNIHTLDLAKEKIQLENNYIKENLNEVISSKEKLITENRELKSTIESIRTENQDTMKELNLQINKLKDDNKNLSKKLDFANEMLDRFRPSKSKEDLNEKGNEDELEDDWGNEI